MLGIDINQINQMRGNQLMGHAREIASNDPVLKAYMDALFRFFTGRDASDLNNNGRALYSVAEGLASNFVGNSAGNVAAFGGLNTVLSSMPMNITNPNRGLEVSHGSGVNTMTVAQQIARGIQNNTDYATGYYGLSAPLAMGLAGRIIRDNGDVGQVNNIDIANTSAGVAGMRSQLISRGNVSEGSYVDKKLETLGSVMEKMEQHNVAVGNISEGMKDMLKNKYGFSEEDILAADKARSGKLNATFLDAGAENKIHEGIKQYSDTIKTLSELFRTEDFDQLEQQAKQLGIQSLTSKNEAERIRQVTRTAIRSAISTGQTTDVVLKDMGAISATLAANNGGRASVTDTEYMYDAISEARRSEESGARTTYTANEKAAIAMNQMSEVKNDYGAIYGAQEAFRIAESYGQLSSEQVEKYNALEARLQTIGKLPPEERVEAMKELQNEFKDYAKSIGFNAEDQRLQQAGDAHKTEEQNLTKIVAGDVNRYNRIKNGLKDIYRGNSNLDKSRLEDVTVATDIIGSTFGGDDKAVDDFMKLSSQYASGKIKDEEYISKLVAMGMDEQDALTIKDKKLSALELNAMYQVRDNKRQNFQYKGTAQIKREKAEESARMLAQSQDLYKSRNKPASEFLSGLISKGGMEADELMTQDVLQHSEHREIGSVRLDGEGGVDANDIMSARQILGYTSSEDFDEWDNLDLSDNNKVHEFLEKKAAAAGKQYDRNTGKFYNFDAEKEGIASDDNFTALGMKVGANGSLTVTGNLSDKKTQERILKGLGLDGADEATKKKFLKEFKKTAKSGTLADMNELINKYSEGKSNLLVTEKGFLATSNKDYNQTADNDTVRKSAAILSSLKGEGNEGDISFDGGKVSANINGESLDSETLKKNIENKTLDEHTKKMIMEDPRKFQEILRKAKSGDASARMFVDYVRNGLEKSTEEVSRSKDSKRNAKDFIDWTSKNFGKTDDDIDLFSVKTDTESNNSGEKIVHRRARALQEQGLGEIKSDKDGNQYFTASKNFLGMEKGEEYTLQEVASRLSKLDKLRNNGESQAGFNADIVKNLIEKFDKDLENDPEKRKEANKNILNVDTERLEDLVQQILDVLEKRIKGGIR